MSGEKAFGLRALMARLARFHDLSSEDQAAIERLLSHSAIIASGQDVVRAGDRTDRCSVILDGMTCSYRLTGDGRRQILSLHLAGEMPDLRSFHLGGTDVGVTAVSECYIGYVPHTALRELCSRRPNLMEALWRETLLQASIVEEGLLNVGRRDALARAAHLMCELMFRQQAAGLTSDQNCSFPLTQTLLADALGLSTVHINRMVQKLRADGLIEWENRCLKVFDWERLREVADFNPAYLHFDRRPPAA